MIIKVEPPRGDPTRALVRGGPSGTFIAYSHGKKSVCLELASPQEDDLASNPVAEAATGFMEGDGINDRPSACEQVSAQLQAAGVGFTEVLPLERVLQTPQARQPGKLRAVRFRDLDFEVPEFPRLGAARQAATLPPAELGQHTLEVLLSAGLEAGACDALVASGAAQVADPRMFAWAAVAR